MEIKARAPVFTTLALIPRLGAYKGRIVSMEPFVRTRTPIRHPAGLWLGIYALLLQALIPFGQALPGPNGAPLVICKVAGFGATTAPGQAPAKGPARGPGVIDAHGCVVCTAVAGPAGPGAHPPVVSVPVAAAMPVAAPTPHSAPNRQGRTLAFRVRAPPRA